MTGRQFGTLLERVGWSGRRLADYLGVAPGTIGGMITGRVSVDPAIAEYLGKVAAAIDQVPLPQRRPQSAPRRQ